MLTNALPQISSSRLPRWLRWLILILTAFFIAFHIGVVALLAIWETQPINNDMFMLLHRITTLSGVERTWVEDEQISTTIKRAAIASEDANFVNHNGFDIIGIENAIKRNEKAGNIIAGGSTISQQLAKNLFLFPQRSYIRKGEETIITLILESMWDKERILTAYLNVAEFGNGIYGVEAAAQHYYHKSAKNLTRQQAATLISMLPNPKYYETHPTDPKLQAQVQKILHRMNGAQLPDDD